VTGIAEVGGQRLDLAALTAAAESVRFLVAYDFRRGD